MVEELKETAVDIAVARTAYGEPTHNAERDEHSDSPPVKTP
jgi:hypothetical protein